MNLSRQSGLFLPENKSVIIFGAGGIGSMTTLLLAKTGYKNITVVDFDVVEPFNIPSQLYGPSDVGKYKVLALRNNIKYLTGIQIDVANKDSVPLADAYNVCILALDSNEARRKIGLSCNAELLISPAMGGLSGVIRFYENIYGGERAKFLEDHPIGIEQENCSEKAIAFNTAGLASLIVAGLATYEKTKELPSPKNICFYNSIIL